MDRFVKGQPCHQQNDDLVSYQGQSSSVAAISPRDARFFLT